ncbi:MAG: signal peptide peptidase SppA [Paludibacteraceae bacterium]|nr:signal peptide peptidase SppA [Paludibacteraceae bacterium]
MAIYIIFCFVVGKKMGNMFSGGKEVSLKSNAINKLDLGDEVVEQGQEENPFESLFSTNSLTTPVKIVGLDDILSNIRLAKENENIRGIYLCSGTSLVGRATAKEIHDALMDFKTSGKFIIAYAPSYTQINYYIASVADEIYLNPVGSIAWHGIAAQKKYFTRALQKLGISMQIIKVGTFKSAVEPFMRTNMSPEDRKQTMQYVNGLWEEIVTAVSKTRQLSVEQLNEYADQFMDTEDPQKYVEYGFVDKLIYTQDIDSIFKAVCGDDYKFFTTNQLKNVKRATSNAPKSVAVLYAEGQIYDESGQGGIVGKDMVKTIDKIAKNDDIKAVVVRVNSPGGSADASEQIWHALEKVKASGKKVVVSMGDLAASGGYYISCGADYIFAQPNTLTGSIGIFGMIPNIRGLRDKLGVDVESVGTNKNATMPVDMIYQGMNYQQTALMQKMVDRGYELFTLRCAEGRHLHQDTIKKVGEGRVWLGKDALALKLVDELGSIDDAIAKACELAEITEYNIQYYPEKKNFMDEFIKSFDTSSEEEKMLAKLKALVSKERVMAIMDPMTIE